MNNKDKSTKPNKSVVDKTSGSSQKKQRKGGNSTKGADAKKLSLEDQFKALLKKIPAKFHLPAQFTDFRLARSVLTSNLISVYQIFVDSLAEIGSEGCDLASVYGDFISYALKRKKYEAFVAMRYFATYDAALRVVLRGKLGSIVEKRVVDIRKLGPNALNFGCYADLCEWLKRAPSSTSNADYFWNNFMFYMKGGSKNGVVLK